jgi:hypothetical protein
MRGREFNTLFGGSGVAIHCARVQRVWRNSAMVANVSKLRCGGSKRSRAEARAPRLSCFGKLAALVLFAVKLSLAPATAQTPSISWSTDILSRYIGGATGARVYDKPVVQTELNAGFQNGFYLNLWGSKSLNGEAPVGNQSHGDVVQFALELNKMFKFRDHMVTPYVKIEPTLSVSGEPNGVYLHVGLRHRFSLADGIAFMQSGRIVYDSGVFGLSPGYNLRYDAEISLDLSKNVTLRLPTFRAFHPITNFEDKRTNYYVYGVGVKARL